jgi:flagellin-like hook-associated protein FlgL
MAEEISEMTKNNILMQSGISVLSQANSMNGHVLKLLGN